MKDDTGLYRREGVSEHGQPYLIQQNIGEPAIFKYSAYSRRRDGRWDIQWSFPTVREALAYVRGFRPPLGEAP